VPSTAETSVDLFHRGRFALVQPKKGVHRAGTDALVLAAAVPSGLSGTVADFGAGAGAAALAVASRCPQANVLLIENEPAMLRAAELTLAHEANRHLAPRASLLAADVTLAGKAREAAGLPAGSADFVIMNPPFNDPRDRASPDATRRQAHVMDDLLFERWLRSAAAVLRPRGGVAVIARPVSIGPIIAALSGRFGGARIVPVHARPDAPAIRIVVRAVLASRALLEIMPPLVLHGATGNGFSPRMEAIGAGEASLFGD
jgi:tRNA1(Val) A37 N6-methylase TrmN6